MVSVWFSPSSAEHCLAAASQCSFAEDSRKEAYNKGSPDGQIMKSIYICSKNLDKDIEICKQVNLFDIIIPAVWEAEEIHKQGTVDTSERN